MPPKKGAKPDTKSVVSKSAIGSIMDSKGLSKDEEKALKSKIAADEKERKKAADLEKRQGAANAAENKRKKQEEERREAEWQV